MNYTDELLRHLPMLKEMARKYCKDELDREDLVSDTILRLWLHRDDFDERHALKSLAWKIMQNLYINKYNRHKCVAFVELFSTSEPINHVHADDLIRVKQVAEIVKEASARSVCIRPVVMYALGYSYKEISDALDIPMGTVQRRIHEGRRMLRDELGE